MNMVLLFCFACEASEYFEFQYSALKRNYRAHIIHIWTNICQEIRSKKTGCKP